MFKVSCETPERTEGPTLTRKEQRHLDVLARRADHLAARIAGTERRDLSYDREELAALRWAIALLGGARPPGLVLVRRREREGSRG